METETPASPSRGLALFDRYAVAVATIMGTLLAGVVLVWMNYRAMGRPDLARRALQIGIVAEVLVMLLVVAVPSNSLTQLVPLAIQVGLAWFGSAWLQGAAIEWHLQRGAQLQSVWRAAGIGFLVGLVIVFLAVMVLATLGALGLITLPAPPAVTPA